MSGGQRPGQKRRSDGQKAIVLISVCLIGYGLGVCINKISSV